MIKKLLIAICLALSLSGSALAVETSQPEVPKPDFMVGPQEGQSAEDTQDRVLNVTIPRVINLAAGLLGIATFTAVLIAAIVLVTSFGNEDKVNRAKRNLQYSLLGFGLVLLSYAIVSIVVSISVQDQSSFIPTAYAVELDNSAQNKLELLLPSQKDLIQDPSGGQVELPSGNLVTEVLPSLVLNLLYLFGFMVLAAIIVAGVYLVTGRGNEEMVDKAKKIIIYLSIALALVAFAYAIIYGLATLNLNNNPNDTSFETIPEITDQ